MNRFSMHKKFILIALSFVMLPSFVLASEIHLESNKKEFKVREQFVVDIFVQSSELINAIEGQVLYPKDALDIKEIRDGNSVISLWIEKPVVTNDGVVSFSGITPGGFSGSDNRVFSVVFEAKSEGVASIEIGSIKALQNDGIGTESQITTSGISVVAKSSGNSVIKETIVDNESPESFTPIVAENKGILDGKKFIVFATQDKISGLKRYEIKESRFPILSFLFPWREAKSPYVLEDQSLKSQIFVRAIDNVGNEIVVEVMPTNGLYWYAQLFYWVIIAGMGGVAIFATMKAWKRIFT